MQQTALVCYRDIAGTVIGSIETANPNMRTLARLTLQIVFYYTLSLAVAYTA